MTSKNIYKSLGGLDPELIMKAAPAEKVQKKKKNTWVKWASLAACIAVIVSAIIVVPMLREDGSSIIPNPDNQSVVNNSETTKLPLPLFAPNTFASFEDFEKHEKEAGEKAVKYYYKPSALLPEYEFSKITKRDDVYVMIDYTISSKNSKYDEKLDGYDIERLSTLICKTSLFPDGKKTLEASYIKNGYKPIEYDGKTYYRFDEYSINNKQLIGYEIVFLIDNDLIFMHLPAVDTFENMMKLANVVKVYLE